MVPRLTQAFMLFEACPPLFSPDLQLPASDPEAPEGRGKPSKALKVSARGLKVSALIPELFFHPPEKLVKRGGGGWFWDEAY